MERSRIIDRIKKLGALSSNSAASENEVNIATKAMQKLMMEHQVAEWELKASSVTTEPSDLIEYEDWYIDSFLKKSEGTWITDLIAAVCRENMSHMLFKGKEYVIIYSPRGTLFMIQTIVISLIPMLRESGKTATAAFKKEHPAHNPNVFKRQYFIGAVSGVIAALREAKLDLKRDNPDNFNKLTIISDKLVKQVDTLISMHYPNLRAKPSHGPRKASIGAYEKGYADGKSAMKGFEQSRYLK